MCKLYDFSLSNNEINVKKRTKKNKNKNILTHVAKIVTKSTVLLKMYKLYIEIPLQVN